MIDEEYCVLTLTLTNGHSPRVSNVKEKNAADGVKQIKIGLLKSICNRSQAYCKKRETELNSSKIKGRKVFKCGNELLENVRREVSQYD